MFGIGETLSCVYGGQGYRNGVREGHLKTAEGFIGYPAPQAAGTAEPFRSGAARAPEGPQRGAGGCVAGRKAGVSEMLARGLSIRDIEDAFKDETGWLLLSRTAVSELGERLWADDQDFAGRYLSEYDIAYGASPADTQSSTGSPSGTGPGRGRAGPGGQGPEDIWPDFKTRVTASYQDPSRAIARDLVRGVVADCEADSPSAIACFMDDFEACITHLRLPIAHRRATRTTNLLERLFVKDAGA